MDKNEPNKERLQQAKEKGNERLNKSISEKQNILKDSKYIQK